MISGLDKSYETATVVTESMRQEIEKNARKGWIDLEEGEQISLSRGMLVEGSCKVSPIKSVCLLKYFTTYVHS